MSKKKSYMNNNNLLKEGFIDDIIDQFFPKIKKGFEKRYLDKPRIKKKLAKYDKQLRDIDKKSKKVTKDFEKAFQKETGKKPQRFESSGHDNLDGDFDLGGFDPR